MISLTIIHYVKKIEKNLRRQEKKKFGEGHQKVGSVGFPETRYFCLM